MQTQQITYAALAIAVLASQANAHDTGLKPSAEEIRSWTNFVSEFIPANIISDDNAMAALLQPRTGEPFSRKFSVEQAQSVFADKVVPSQNCFVDVLPDGVLPQEQCDNKGRGSLLSVNMSDGALKYMNVNREPSPADTDGIKFNRDTAAEALTDMVLQLGVPREELGLQFMNANELIAAAGRSESSDPEPEVSKTMAVFLTLPRCMQVDYSAFDACIPVTDGGVRAALVDGGRREPDVVTSWFDVQFRDFEIEPAAKPRTPDSVIQDVAFHLASAADPGDYERLDMSIAYATNAEVASLNGASHCGSRSEGDDGNDAGNSPANLQADRQYLPVLQVFALPPGWRESIEIEPDQLNSISTGIEVFSVPLAEAGEGNNEC